MMDADKIVPRLDGASQPEPHPFEVSQEQEPRLNQRDHRTSASLGDETAEVAAEQHDADLLIHQFVREAACERILVTQLRSIWDKIQEGATDEAAFKEAVGDALAQALAEHARKENERRAAKLRVTISTLEQTTTAAGKFVDPEAAFGDEGDFHDGLQSLGLPQPNILEAMYHEFCVARDSVEEFTAWNSGENKTCPEKEWQFIVEPFEPRSVREDKSPKHWKAKHEYGGNRFPIRLQVFLHAVSATVQAVSAPWMLGVKQQGDTEFGDYKTAHTRDRHDPRWLHHEEVDTVQVVVMRFIRAQVSGISLIKAFGKASERGTLCRQIEGLAADKLAQDIATALALVLKNKDGPSSTCTMDDLTAGLQGIATQEEIDALVDHFHALLRDQHMTGAECIGVRAYTGPAYVKFNGSLRDTTHKDEKTGNTYINSIFATASALRKISGASAIPHGRKLYRGMAGMRLPSKFETESEVGSKGGVEYSFMSTTTKKAVAVSYINASKRRPILFEYDVGSIDRGGSISFMSQYPGEDEVLIPPRSFVEITGAPFAETVDKDGMQMDITIYPAKINCNLKGQTLEQLVAFRKHELHDKRPYILQGCVPVWGKVRDALGKDVAHLPLVTSGSESWEVRFDAQRKREEKTLQDLFATLDDKPAQWFNGDDNYKAALGEVVDFRYHSISRLVMTVICDQRFKHDSPEGEVCRPSAGQAAQEGLQTEDTSGANGAEPILDSLSSNYPLYELQVAGFKNTVECMAESGAGFRVESIDQATQRVANIYRTKRWDSFVLVNNLFFFFAAFCCVTVMAKDWDRWAGFAFAALAAVACLCWGSLGSVRHWLFPTEAPEETKSLVAWMCLKYGLVGVALMLPFILLLILAVSHSYQIDADGSASVQPNYQFTFWSFLLSFGLLALPINLMVSFLVYRRWIRGTKLDHPLGFLALRLAVYPLEFYFYMVFLGHWFWTFLMQWLSPSALAQEWRHDDDWSEHFDRIRSLPHFWTGWYVALAWWVLMEPILGSCASCYFGYTFIRSLQRASPAQVASAAGVLDEAHQDVEAAAQSEPGAG